MTTQGNDAYNSTDADRYKDLIEDIKQQRHDNQIWGQLCSARLLRLANVGAIFGVIAIILAALPQEFWICRVEFQIDKWAATLPAAFSGACFLFIRQMKWSERANAHYYKRDLMDSLYMQLMFEVSKPPTAKEIAEVSAKFREYTIKSADAFAKLNSSFLNLSRDRSNP